MRWLFAIFPVLAFAIATAQEIGIIYRSAKGIHGGLHYLVFDRPSSCKLIFPIDSMTAALLHKKNEYTLKYQMKNDTITFLAADQDTTNWNVRRIIKSRLIVSKNKTLHDVVHGNTYIDKKLVSENCIPFAFEGRLYKQRLRHDGYDYILRIDKLNPKLRKRIKQSNQINLKLDILKGNAAYEKYGRLGMNGVFEISSRK